LPVASFKVFKHVTKIIVIDLCMHYMPMMLHIMYITELKFEKLQICIDRLLKACVFSLTVNNLSSYNINHSLIFFFFFRFKVTMEDPLFSPFEI